MSISFIWIKNKPLPTILFNLRDSVSEWWNCHGERGVDDDDDGEDVCADDDDDDGNRLHKVFWINIFIATHLFSANA